MIACELSTAEMLNEAMLMLAAHPRSIFVGQGVAYDGVATYDSLDGIPMEQRLEMPVAEELQLGVCIGLALQGYLPICIYPRIDFMLRAADSLVNHLDKLAEMSCGQFNPKVIIRTRVGSTTPLNPGPQHSQNHTAAFNAMLTHVIVREITKPEQIMPVYRMAMESERSTLVVEALC